MQISKEEEDMYLNSDWPERPTISVKNFSMRYRKELPLVLKNISFDISAY